MVDGPISPPCRVVHMFSAAPNAITTSDSASSRCAVGDANPPEIPTANGSPAKNPLATAEVAKHSSGQLARAGAARAPHPTAPRRAPR